ncbi:MAG TPA: histidine phosphatase family protein [Candidatus Paceibacterota bacterium]
MERIILVRHGETNINTQGILHDTDDTEPISDVGTKQINLTAEKLREFEPKIVYSSKEVRAIQSGQLIAEKLGIKFEAVDGLQERNWGDLSGRSWTSVQKILDSMSLEERYTYTPPNGESWQTFEHRLIENISRLIKKNKNKTISVITHGGAIRALMPYFLSAPKEESFKYNPDNASITVFDSIDGAFSEVAINDTDHLNKND